MRAGPGTPEGAALRGPGPWRHRSSAPPAPGALRPRATPAPPGSEPGAHGPARPRPPGPRGPAAGPRRARPCRALSSATARPEAPARGAGLGAAGAAAGVPGAPGRRDAFGGRRSERSGARGRPRGLERGGGGGPSREGRPRREPCCPHPQQAAGRGGGRTCSAPASPRGSIRAGGASCAPCRVGTASAVGAQGNRGSGGFSPRSFWKEESGELGAEVRELGSGHWGEDEGVRWEPGASGSWRQVGAGFWRVVCGEVMGGTLKARFR